MRKLFRLSKAKRQSGVGREQRTNDRYVGLSNRSSQGPHDRSVGVVRDKPRQNDHRSSILRKVSGPSSSSSFSRKRKHARIFSTIKVKIHQRDWTDAFLNHPSNPPGNGWSPVGGKKPPVRRGDDREEGKREERGKRPSRKRVVKIVKRCWWCRRRRHVISLLFLFSLSLSLSLSLSVCSRLSTVEARRGLHRESDHRVNGCLTPRTKADEKGGARENDDIPSCTLENVIFPSHHRRFACVALYLSQNAVARAVEREGNAPSSSSRETSSIVRATTRERLSSSFVSFDDRETRERTHTRQNR